MKVRFLYPRPPSYRDQSQLSTVIHVILSPAAGVAEMPSLLRGEAISPPDAENIGSRNYAETAAAVVTGAGYDDAAFEEMREACRKESNVSWLRPDMSKAAPPPGPGYGEAMVERVKVCLRELAEGGKSKGDGVYFY